jgi:hypothetical protein
MNRMIWILVLGSLCVPSLALAGKGKVEVVSAKWKAISNQEDQSETRLLVQFDLPPEAMGKRIEAAYFDWPMMAEARSRESTEEPWVSVVVQELDRSWEKGTVSWDQPWGNPGGDLRAERSAAALLVPGEMRSTRFEITDTVQAWVKGTRENHGVAISVGGRVVPLTTVTDHAGSEDSSPRLRIWYK